MYNKVDGKSNVYLIVLYLGSDVLIKMGEWKLEIQNESFGIFKVYSKIK